MLFVWLQRWTALFRTMRQGTVTHGGGEQAAHVLHQLHVHFAVAELADVGAAQRDHQVPRDLLRDGKALRPPLGLHHALVGPPGAGALDLALDLHRVADTQLALLDLGQLRTAGVGESMLETRFQPVYVGDVARVNMDFLETRASGIYNLGTGRAQTFNELAAATVNACRALEGKPAPRKTKSAPDLVWDAMLRLVERADIDFVYTTGEPATVLVVEQEVVAGAAEQVVRARVAPEGVLPPAAPRHVVPLPVEEDVLAVLPLEDVVAAPAVQRVPAGRAEQPV